jgi:hypothetical protein
MVTICYGVFEVQATKLWIAIKKNSLSFIATISLLFREHSNYNNFFCKSTKFHYAHYG